MLEEAIPALWSAVHGWFTPAVLFIVLNIVIGTIAVTSKVAAAGATAEGEDAAAAGAGGVEPHRRLSRVPSMAFDRLRSFNLSRFAAAEPEPAVAAVADLVGYEQEPQAPAPAAAAEEVSGVGVVAVAVEAQREPENPHAATVERSRSDSAAGAAGAGAGLPRLPTRLHKSASDKSAFAHFGAEEVEEAVRAAVEARRPATTRDAARGRGGRRLPVAESSSDESDGWSSDEDEEEDEAAAAGFGGGEVDARADDFINNFRHQLKLQRIDSILRNRRAQAAAGV